MKYLLCSWTATAVGTTLLLALLFPQSNYHTNVSPGDDPLWVFALLGITLLVALLYPRRTYHKCVPPIPGTRCCGQTPGVLKLHSKEMAYLADRFATASDTKAIVHVRSTVYVLGRQGDELDEEGILAVLNDLERNTGRRHQASTPILRVVK